MYDQLVEHTKRALGLAIGLLVLRLYAGLTICQAGFDKFPTSAWFSDQVSGLGFPAPSAFAFLASFAELAGGLLLVLGFFTRPAALFCGVTMGVAAFGFHKVTPMFAMHIAQLYFGVFAALVLTGAGDFSMDALLRRRRGAAQPSRATMVGVFGLVSALLVVAGFRETQTTVEPGGQSEINTVSVAGSFNDWDVAATPMTKLDGKLWEAVVTMTKVGPIEFKFAANESWDISGGENDQNTKGFPVAGQLEMRSDAENIRLAGISFDSFRHQAREHLDELNTRRKHAVVEALKVSM